ncbi:MAG TPA: hypothetical protein VJB41_01940 [Patescibacteria group bacterium]|nr:hypothetical protein [Patescibacteria group bacterium]
MNKNEFLKHREEVVVTGIERITRESIKPRISEVGGTIIILQRNAKDDRRLDSEDIGALEAEAAEQTFLHAREFFDKIFEGMDDKERETIDVMIIAGDTTLITPDGIKSYHKRAVETASQVIAGLKESMAKFSLREQQLLNTAASPDGGVIEVSELRDLLMLEKSPEFVKFLIDKYGTGVKFWDAYESDAERETRLQMGAEGPDEIADRVNYALSLHAQIAEEYHQANPGRRLIVWAVSHYDSISPFIKKYIVGMEMSSYLPVDQGAGITISIDKTGKATTTIQDQELILNEQ